VSHVSSFSSVKLSAALYYSIRQNRSCSRALEFIAVTSVLKGRTFRSIIVLEINFPEEEIDDL
jgi:hypothetical protein